MGYGGSRADAGRALGKSGDNGLDGVIDQDALGLDRVYLQAKRYKFENAVGESEVRGFAGSLEGAKANKGVFVTTSHFTPQARAFAEKIARRIVLIDGQQLAQLMIKYDVGVRIEETLHIKKIDEDFSYRNSADDAPVSRYFSEPPAPLFFASGIWSSM
jgi:restriction system protein